jgi:hypothetical protein
MNTHWIDSSQQLPPKQTAVRVKLEGYAREFIGFLSHNGEWFIRNAAKQRVKFPAKVTHWSKA